MTKIRLEIEGDSINDVMTTIKDMLPEGATSPAAPLDAMTLQELLLYVDQRCQAEGYEMEVTRHPAASRKAEARNKLRGDLEESLKLEEAKSKPSEPEPDVAPAKAKKAKANGKAADTTKDKATCIKILQDLYASGHKAEVNKILADFGNGAKNFNVIPEDQFGPILGAIEALQV